MIKIQKSATADSRTCDYSKVTKEQLYQSSRQHRQDIEQGLTFFKSLLSQAIDDHDLDKLSNVDGFHRDFLTGFEQHEWWDNHRKVNRHHLLEADGVPLDVNLIDVLDMIVDCVMAGMGRNGSVYPLDIPPEVLMTAFQNTVSLLKSKVEVEG